MSAYRTLDDIDPAGQRVIVRADLNVPVREGRVSDATRIERLVPTLAELADRGADKIVVLSHFDRPKGRVVPEMSLRPVAEVLSALLGRDVVFAETDWRDGKAAETVAAASAGSVILAENTRFHPGEEKNEADFAAELARLGDAYVNDAFSAAHRAHASTEGIAHVLPAYAGRAMQAELDALTLALEAPERPVYAIVGGAKVSTKLDLLGNLVGRVQGLVIGGGMANTFLAARGAGIGKSLAERDMLDTAREIEAKAAAAGCEILLPADAVLASEFKAGAAARAAGLDDVGEKEMILDIGPATASMLAEKLASARTIVWNGPVGAFEIEPFDKGTVTLAQAVALLTDGGAVRSVAGGGDTVAALNHAGVADRFTYVSTAGGAFLEWLEGKALPGVEALRA